MSETKHTPKLPLNFDGNFIFDADNYPVCQFFNKHEEDFEHKKEYAALIMEAANSHALLREAEQMLTWVCPAVHEMQRGRITELISRIRADREAQEKPEAPIG